MSGAGAISAFRERFGGSEDTDALVSLINVAFRPEQVAIEGDRINAEKLQPLFSEGRFILLEDHQGLAGCVYAEVRGKRGYVGLLSLRPALHGRGLGRRLMALADRAGARVLGAYEWGLGDKTKKANAALAGIGGTRRILVSDTMLAEYSDDEIEVVLAHEIAHHVHGDIWKGIVFESALLVLGFYLASVVLRAAAAPAGLLGVDDVAGLPLLMLAAGAVSVVMVPVAHAMSRAFERSADRFALNLTRNPNAFISAMRRLAAQNLAEEHPSRVVQWLFYSHPPIRDRIAAAQAFRAG